MKRFIVLFILVLLLSGCKIGVDGAPAARGALIEEQATVEIVCYTVTPIPTPTCPCPTCPPTTPVATATLTPTPESTPEVLWDERLDDLHVSIQQVAGARYQIIAVWMTKNGNWDDVPAWAKYWQLDSLGGDRHVFGRCLDKAGNPINKAFVLSWPGGSDARTPEADGWANLPMAGHNWDPANGPGAYGWQALNGDGITGFDMPHNWHWSYFVVWQEAPTYVKSEWERRGFSRD